LPMYYATINQHLLIHLPHRIKVTGPLHCSHLMAAERENGFVKRMVTSRRAIPAVISNRIELLVALDHERAARPEQFVCAPARSRPGGLVPLGEPAPFEIQSGHRDVHLDESDSRPYKLLPSEHELLHHMVRTRSVEYDNLVREFERDKKTKQSLKEFLCWRPQRHLTDLERVLVKGVSANAVVFDRVEVNGVHFRAKALEDDKGFTTRNCGISIRYLDPVTNKQRIGYGYLQRVLKYSPFSSATTSAHHEQPYPSLASLEGLLFVRAEWFETVGRQTNGVVLVRAATGSSFLSRYSIGALADVRPVHVTFATATPLSRSFYVIEF